MSGGEDMIHHGTKQVIKTRWLCIAPEPVLVRPTTILYDEKDETTSTSRSGLNEVNIIMPGTIVEATNYSLVYSTEQASTVLWLYVQQESIGVEGWVPIGHRRRGANLTFDHVVLERVDVVSLRTSSSSSRMKHISLPVQSNHLIWKLISTEYVAHFYGALDHRSCLLEPMVLLHHFVTMFREVGCSGMKLESKLESKKSHPCGNGSETFFSASSRSPSPVNPQRLVLPPPTQSTSHHPLFPSSKNTTMFDAARSSNSPNYLPQTLYDDVPSDVSTGGGTTVPTVPCPAQPQGSLLKAKSMSNISSSSAPGRPLLPSDAVGEKLSVRQQEQHPPRYGPPPPLASNNRDVTSPMRNFKPKMTTLLLDHVPMSQSMDFPSCSLEGQPPLDSSSPQSLRLLFSAPPAQQQQASHELLTDYFDPSMTGVLKSASEIKLSDIHQLDAVLLPKYHAATMVTALSSAALSVGTPRRGGSPCAMSNANEQYSMIPLRKPSFLTGDDKTITETKRSGEEDPTSLDGESLRGNVIRSTATINPRDYHSPRTSPTFRNSSPTMDSLSSSFSRRGRQDAAGPLRRSSSVQNPLEVIASCTTPVVLLIQRISPEDHQPLCNDDPMDRLTYWDCCLQLHNTEYRYTSEEGITIKSTAATSSATLRRYQQKASQRAEDNSQQLSNHYYHDCTTLHDITSIPLGKIAISPVDVRDVVKQLQWNFDNGLRASSAEFVKQLWDGIKARRLDANLGALSDFPPWIK